jgi:hypothetical protein
MILFEELTKSMNSFKNNKALGNDGITVEFYRKFGGIIGKPLLNKLNYSYTVGQRSTSQRQEIITF